MIMKERINEAKEKAQQFAKEQDIKNRARKVSKDDITKKDFGKEEITVHDDEMLDVFKKESDEEEELDTKVSKAKGPKKGMSLFKKKLAKKKKKQKNLQQQKKKEDITDKIMKEEGHRSKPKKINPLSASILIELNEEISAKLSKEGALSKLSITGKGFVQIMDPKMAKCEILIDIEKFKGLR